MKSWVQVSFSVPRIIKLQKKLFWWTWLLKSSLQMIFLHPSRKEKSWSWSWWCLIHLCFFRGHKDDLIVHNIRLIKLSKETVEANELNCPACLRKFQRLNQIQGHFRECTIRIVKELDNLVSTEHIQDEDPNKFKDVDGEKILGDFVNALKSKKGSNSLKRVQPRKQQSSLSCSKCKASFATKESRTLHNCDSKFDQCTDLGGVRQARHQSKPFTESRLQEKKLRRKTGEENRDTHKNTSTTTREDESRSAQPPNAFSSESSEDERGPDVGDLKVIILLSVSEVEILFNISSLGFVVVKSWGQRSYFFFVVVAIYYKS